MSTIITYYSAHSAFAYLGWAELMRIAAKHNATILHKPIPLSPVVEAQGSLSFAERTQPHVDYFFGREIERWAEYRKVPVISHRPTFHDADYTLASLMILALGESGSQTDAFAHAVLEAHWRDDADLSDRATLVRLADGLGLDGASLADAAPAFQSAYEDNARAAIAANVFGSPTYVVNGDPFYGQDRLELVDRALARPFAESTWRNPSVG